MLGSKDWLMLAVIFASMAVGVTLGAFSSLFRPLPMACMMAFLFMSFLSYRLSNVLRAIGSSWAWILVFLSLKLVLLPIAVFAVFRCLLPRYALGALLLSGISTGVVSPFFAELLRGNTPMVLFILIGSSLLVPFTLPPLVKILAGEAMDIHLGDMIRLLCIIVFIPVVLSEASNRWLPGLVQFVRNRQYGFALALFTLTNLGVFSKHADFFRQHPAVILEAFAVATALAAVYFVAGILCAIGRPLEDQLALPIVFGMMNYVLVIVFSSQFFGPLEPTLAAVYSVPFFVLLVPLRLYGRWSERR
ncbi:MAG: bile acid:sodium symporter [Deltaproteobacteria bacterium]|nr:bile acid:sodium symporter [Deltaproteobacteria bacterium]